MVEESLLVGKDMVLQFMLTHMHVPAQHWFGEVYLISPRHQMFVWYSPF